jgi:hypothetical protein
MEVALHNHPILPPVVPFARAKGGNVRSRRLAPTLEVVDPRWVGLLPEARSVKTSLNKRTDGRTPTYISQRWTKITTEAMPCGVR